MIDLPIDAAVPEILAAARDRRALVVVAPPGAGKTTRVPVALIRSGLLSRAHPNLVLLQPRRIAARAAAARIAAENGWSVGREVGYQIRFERRIGPSTRIRVLTEGILTRQLMADPYLEGVGAVLLDEFHERSIHSDLALALLQEVREALRSDLILVVMSATLDTSAVARFLGDCPVVRVEGRSFPVTVEHLPTEPRMPLSRRVALGMQTVLEGSAPGRDAGDVLVFLPGMEEIRRTGRELMPLAERHDLEVVPLHGSLPAAEQDRALRPADRRKVVLSTNVAETSLTIEGVRTVLDTGYARYAEHDPARGLGRLELRRISRASAAQRAGRAGRTAPGRCIRLWSPRDERGMREFDPPEIARVDLCATVLALHAWGQSDPARFGWFEPPPTEALEAAERLLAWLGALGADGRITPLGTRMLDLPIHPRLARLLLAAARDGRLHEGATLAALLSEKDLLADPTLGMPATSRGGDRSGLRSASDLLVRMDRLEEAEHAGYSARLRVRGIDPSAARRIARVRDDLLRATRRFSPGPEGPAPASGGDDDDDTALLRYLLLAYPDRVVRRRSPGAPSGVMVGGRGVRLDEASTVRDAEFFLALDARDERRGGATEVRVRIASAVERDWLTCDALGLTDREQSVEFDETSGRVVGIVRLLYHDLVLREERHGTVEPGEAAAALARALTPRAVAFLREDEAAASWLDRVACLRIWMPELGLPGFDEPMLAEILESACAGCRSVAEVRQTPLVPLLATRLDQAQRRALAEHAPEHLTVPSGSRIRLTYEIGRPPVLAVRLQELFGWSETPRVAAGRVPVLLHLLAPNFRPVQITDDLRSFWVNTYYQVRKDLRNRYPRHAWPEDPRAAQAEARGGRRRG